MTRRLPSHKRIRVLVFPETTSPYYPLLYEALKQADAAIEVRVLTNPTRFPSINLVCYPFLLLGYRLRGYRIFHIHWYYMFRIPRLNSSVLNAVLRAYTMLFVRLVAALHYRIIWTAHETIPHFVQSPWDRNGAARVARHTVARAYSVIIHSEHILESEFRRYHIFPKRVELIPHGNLVGVYRDDTSDADARTALGLRTTSRVVLFFGLIRQYKGLDHLIWALRQLELNDVEVVIAGECVEPAICNEILEARAGLPIHFHQGYVPDDRVASYFKAADIVCLPFREITTSGSALLALSFGKPIIAPRLGALNDFPDDVGWFYDMPTCRKLLDALRTALTAIDLEERGTAALRYANSVSWHRSAELTAQLYRAAVAESR